jgi:anti-sigma-K factor RskA
LEELELYALGALHEDEAAKLKAHVALCSECAMKLAEAHGNVALLGFAARQERPAGTIKAELMARIHLDREKDHASAWAVSANGGKRNGTNAGVAKGKKVPWKNMALVVIAVALALVSLGLSWENRKLSAELAKERQAAGTLLEDHKQIEKLVSILAAPDTLTVKLAETGQAARAGGAVKYNRRLGIIVYSAQLPAPPAGKNYQMWLVPAKGEPISEGVLRPEIRAWGNLWTAAVPAGAEVKEFMVTIESAGGVTQPTGPKVLEGTN